VRVQDDNLVVRCPPADTDRYLEQPGTTRMPMKGKPNLRGWLVVPPERLAPTHELHAWVRLSVQTALGRREPFGHQVNFIIIAKHLHVMTSKQAHWEQVYTQKQPDEVSWYQPVPTPSLDYITQAAGWPGQPQPIRLWDMGGGDGYLAEHLLPDPRFALTVLDIAAPVLARLQARLGANAQQVQTLQADLATYTPPANSVDIWHDRAAFHFLTDPAHQQHYAQAAAQAVPPGGALILATFAPDGPERGAATCPFSAMMPRNWPPSLRPTLPCNNTAATAT